MNAAEFAIAQLKRLEEEIKAWRDAYFALEWVEETGECLAGCGGNASEGHNDGCTFIANLPEKAAQP